MSENKLTPMQVHYELLVWWRDETIKKKHAVPEDIEYYDGMIWAFELLMNSIEVKGLEKEKEVMCEFAEEYVGSCLIDYPKIEVIFNQTFNNGENGK